MTFDQFCGPSYQTIQEETINLHIEPILGQKRFQLRQDPGLSVFFNSGVTAPVRGMLAQNAHVFAVIGSTIYDLGPAGEILFSYGPISDDGLPVVMAGNATQLAAIYSGGIPYVVQAGTLTPIGWLPEPCVSVGYLNTFFLFLAISGNGFYFSNPGTATAGDALQFVAAEASANKYIAMLVVDERVWLFGNKISQAFNPTTDPARPFLADLSAVVPWGTVAAASPIAIGNSIYLLSRNKETQGIAIRLDGATATRVSTPIIERFWESYPSLEDAVSYAVSWAGHLCWRIWFPDADETWQLDTTTNDWTKALDWDPATNTFHAHRGMCSAVEFGHVLVGDRENGKIYKLSPAYLNDDDHKMRCVRRAPVITNENESVSYRRFELEMEEVGVGDGSVL